MTHTAIKQAQTQTVQEPVGHTDGDGMAWAVLHAKSEALAIEASIANKNRDAARAQDLYRSAAQFENQALSILDASKTRTRGITAVSAVALWFKGGEYARAEQIAHAALADATMPDFARQELRNLVKAIWTGSKKQVQEQLI
jgi:hypothetical protein